MLGIEDPWIAIAYLLCLAATLLCVIYGLTHWNRGAEVEPAQIQEEAEWEVEERQVEEAL